jgi:hypothetical protein
MPNLLDPLSIFQLNLFIMSWEGMEIVNFIYSLFLIFSIQTKILCFIALTIFSLNSKPFWIECVSNFQVQQDILLTIDSFSFSISLKKDNQIYQSAFLYVWLLVKHYHKWLSIILTFSKQELIFYNGLHHFEVPPTTLIYVNCNHLWCQKMF